MPRFLLAFVLAAATACSSTITPAPTSSALADDRIQLLHTNDIHGRLDADIVRSADASSAFRSGGLAQLAGQVALFRARANTVVSVALTGADLAAVVGRAACVAGRLHMSGVVVSFRFDGAPNCVTSITIGGVPLAATRTYRVATIDYLLLGGDGHTGFANGGNVIYGDVEVDVVAAYIAAHSPVSPRVEGRLAQER